MEKDKGIKLKKMDSSSGRTGWTNEYKTTSGEKIISHHCLLPGYQFSVNPINSMTPPPV
jgi:hypothetical protein